MHLLDILEDRQADNSNELLRMEVAVTIDAAKVFVQKTYVLEGDRVLSIGAYPHLQEIATAAANGYYPNVAATAKVIALNDPARQEDLQ